MRGMRLRWPLKKFTNGRPVDLINFELKAALLAAGYAVVTIDVRGTGQPAHHKRHTLLHMRPASCIAVLLT